MAKKRLVKRAQGADCRLTVMLDRRLRPAADTGSQGAGTKRQSRACDARGSWRLSRRRGHQTGRHQRSDLRHPGHRWPERDQPSYAAAANAGLTQHNPYGLVLLHSTALKTMTIGFPAPLRYERKLVLRVTVNEPNVVQILGNVIHGAA